MKFWKLSSRAIWNEHKQIVSLILCLRQKCFHGYTKCKRYAWTDPYTSVFQTSDPALCNFSDPSKSVIIKSNALLWTFQNKHVTMNLTRGKFSPAENERSICVRHMVPRCITRHWNCLDGKSMLHNRRCRNEAVWAASLKLPSFFGNCFFNKRLSPPDVILRLHLHVVNTTVFNTHFCVYFRITMKCVRNHCRCTIFGDPPF